MGVGVRNIFIRLLIFMVWAILVVFMSRILILMWNISMRVCVGVCMRVCVAISMSGIRVSGVAVVRVRIRMRGIRMHSIYGQLTVALGNNSNLAARQILPCLQDDIHLFIENGLKSRIGLNDAGND